MFTVNKEKLRARLGNSQKMRTTESQQCTTDIQLFISTPFCPPVWGIFTPKTASIICLSRLLFSLTCLLQNPPKIFRKAVGDGVFCDPPRSILKTKNRCNYVAITNNKSWPGDYPHPPGLLSWAPPPPKPVREWEWGWGTDHGVVRGVGLKNN
jgi:hypothetical protein